MAAGIGERYASRLFRRPRGDDDVYSIAPADSSADEFLIVDAFGRWRLDAGLS